MNVGRCNYNFNNTHIIKNHSDSGKSASGKSAFQPAFKSQFEINGDSAVTRGQIFTLGMIMNNFWVRNARLTFMNIKNQNVYGKFKIQVADSKDRIIENILRNNNIQYEKKEGQYYY